MNALVTIETLTPAIVFAPGGVEGIISKLETDVRAIERDITTPDGREAVKSLAYKVARSKTALDDMGKELVAGIKAQAGTIDAERRIIRDRLDALRDEVRGPLTAWEDAETARVARHEAAIVWIIGSRHFASAQPTSVEVGARITELSRVLGSNFEEFEERAIAAGRDASCTLDAILAATIRNEADAAELAELRRLKAERDERDAAEQLERERVERARIAAEEKATRERVAAAHQAEQDGIARERERLAEIARAEQAEADKQAAAAKAVEDERQRVAAAAAAEKAAAVKREANKRHREKVIGDVLRAFIAHGVDQAAASDTIEAIVRGEIPRISISF